MRSWAWLERLRILRPIVTSAHAAGGTTTNENSASRHEAANTHTRQPSSVSPSLSRLLMPAASEPRSASTSFVRRDMISPDRRSCRNASGRLCRCSNSARRRSRIAACSTDTLR